jgi:hypothetical protein
MPYMRIKPIGAGTMADPFRVPLPTYRMVADLGAAAGWIIEVLDADVPDSATVIAINVPGIGVVNVVTGLTAGQIAAWNAKLDPRYPTRDRTSQSQVA